MQAFFFIGTASNSSEDLFGVTSGKSYLCKSKFDIHLENVTMEVHEVHIQAFIEEGKDYGAGKFNLSFACIICIHFIKTC